MSENNRQNDEASSLQPTLNISHNVEWDVEPMVTGGVEKTMAMLNKTKDELKNLRNFASSFSLKTLIEFISQQKVTAVDCFDERLSKEQLSTFITKKCIWTYCGWEGIILLFDKVQDRHPKLALKFMPHWLQSYREKRLLNSIKLQQMSSHHKFVQPLAMSIRTTFGFINLEHMGDFMSIYNIMEYTHSLLPYNFITYYFSCMVQAINYLHHLGIVHRDLKTDNVVINSQFVPKLIDFGLAKKFPRSQQNYRAKLSLVVDSFYCPPEVAILSKLKKRQANGKDVNNEDESHVIDHDKVDIWHLGYFLLDLLIGTDQDHVYSKLNSRNKDNWKLKFCDQCKMLMENNAEFLTKESKICTELLRKSSADRPTLIYIQNKKKYKEIMNAFSEDPPNLRTYLEKQKSNTDSKYAEIVFSNQIDNNHNNLLNNF